MREGWKLVQALVTVLIILLVGVSYTLQNSIMNYFRALEEAEVMLNSGLIFSTLAIIGALIPFLFFVIAVLYLIRRQDR